MNSFILLFLLWAIFYFLHSILITDWFKDLIDKQIGSLMRYYRLSYNIFSTITFLAILWYSATLPVVQLVPKSIITHYSGLFLAVTGILVGKRGFKPYDTKEFLGISQAKGKYASKSSLIKTGILAKVRHPLYSATILIVIGFFLYSPTLANGITVASALLYLLVGIPLEEKKLEKHFGEEYIKYKKEVPSVVPRIKF